MKERVFQVALLSNPDVKTTGILRDISPQADPQTRTWQVRVALNDQPAMALGASATIEIPSSTLPGYRIPASALSRAINPPSLLLVITEAQLREVTLSGYSAASAFVSSGLHPGDKVITAG
jgi:multidrug efflux pump subunit AcrA (membrane-fusion protein)